MKFKDRLYWFSRNLLAFALVITVGVIYFIWFILYSVSGAFMSLTVTDGSETIGWPHEWNWRNPGC